ncbi:MAG: UDP-N-acetylmuramoyl-L-alanine--D-glutamate ligase [Ignavibacteriaceae bacterium]|jgi:UDP-N-acetylmuramoylalanine--D-glutamate ligase|nr:UDP-N-acetylmuramoyl-L-alanine--D-glutamate ligase [Ignavibacteriaceae bacterium]
MNIENKKISILGAVRSGVAAAKLAKKLNAIPFVSDMGSKESLAKTIDELERLNINYETNEHSEKVFDCDLIIVSPGVPTESFVIQKAIEKKIKIVSELEFASSFCKGKIISISGTNGKTTTTSLCSHVLNNCGLKSYTAGNIGLAFSEIALDVNEDEFVALETSSFQLDFIDGFKPFISVMLNITPDHLDRYKDSFQLYKEAKYKILKNQDETDYYVYNEDDTNTYDDLKNRKVNFTGFSTKKILQNGSFYNNGELFFINNGKREIICNKNDLLIKGEHNISNALSVICIAKIIGISSDSIKTSLETFAGVEHRLEYVRTIEGVDFVNDSKATNVDSVWVALRSFEKPLYLILGGKDKGNNYDQIKDLVVEKVKKIYAIGSSADKVCNYFSSIVETEKIDSLEGCVLKGREEAIDGSVVLLSPACASFDMFNNYEHRGEVFKKAVRELI